MGAKRLFMALISRVAEEEGHRIGET